MIKAEDFVTYAKNLARDHYTKGSVPFRKNGGDLNGMDCGGFIENCLRHFGVNTNYDGSNDLFRNAGDDPMWVDCAYDDGIVVPGALCFMCNDNYSDIPVKYKGDGKPNAYSVGIVISGNQALRYSKDRQCFYVDDIPRKHTAKAWSHVMLCRHIDY